MADKKISQLTAATTVNDDAIFPMVQEVSGQDETLKAGIGILKLKIAGKELTSTLTAGSTSLTFSDAAILTTSTVDFYTDVFGVSPSNAVVTAGQIVLTFSAQASDITVKVRIT